MGISDRIDAFVALGEKIRGLAPSDLEILTRKAQSENGWFTPANVANAFQGIGYMLQSESLARWISNYKTEIESPKVVGIVMAGNIPLVGFHDLMCVLVAGHVAAVKVSSQDTSLTKTVIEWLLAIEPRFKKNISIRERLTGVDAVIATGSDNTSRYFEYYFRNIPRIIRKNRTSVAVLNGQESADELNRLGQDIFMYFGLGCRNVSKLLVPIGYKPDPFFEGIAHYQAIGDHHKYKNNYDYYRSIFLVNSTTHFDNGFLIWLPTTELVSPVSVIYAQAYSNEEELNDYLELNKEKLQCVVGKGFTPFGKAQLPEVWEYADNVDTMAFLLDLR